LAGQGFDLGAFIKQHGSPHYPTQRNPVGKVNQKFWAELFAEYNQVFNEGSEAQYYKYRDPKLITAHPMGIYEPFARELAFNQIANDIRQAALTWPGYDVLEQFANARDINAIMSHTDGLLYKKGVFNEPKDFVHVKNGVIKIANGSPVLVGFSPKLISRNS